MKSRFLSYSTALESGSVQVDRAIGCGNDLVDRSCPCFLEELSGGRLRG